MYFAPLRAFTQSLRFRLMLWIGFVSVVTAMFTLWGMREGVRLTLVDKVDHVLEDDLEEVRLLLKEEQLTQEALRDFLDRKSRGHHQPGWFVQIINREGKVDWESEGAPANLPDMSKSGNRTIEQGSLHLREVDADLPDAVGGHVRMGVDMQFLSTDMARIDRLALFVGLAVFLLAPIASYYLAAGAIEPVSVMINTMSRIRASVIDERLAVRGAGDELDKLAITFNSLLDRIAADLAEKRDFLANAAHELRTPLAAIRNSIEVTLNSDRSPGDYQETLADVLEQCGSLQLTVNQLLLLAEAKSTEQELGQETVSLSEIVGKSLEMFEAAADVAEVQLHSRIKPDVTIEANRLHVSQIINNLIDNAIKYTPAGGNICVELQPVDSGGAEFRVRDSGIGIAEDQAPRIFERFYRADESHNSGNQRRGSGLGLSIVKSLVDRYGGEIEATSTLGVGSSFAVRWPNAKNGLESPQSQELSPSAPYSTLAAPN
jgi:two-component system, OmpR family, heavy metal sensor histidine kinase CusS